MHKRQKQSILKKLYNKRYLLHNTILFINFLTMFFLTIGCNTKVLIVYIISLIYSFLYMYFN